MGMIDVKAEIAKLDAEIADPENECILVELEFTKNYLLEAAERGPGTESACERVFTEREQLCAALDAAIKDSGAAFGDVIYALKWLRTAYEDKGSDLLNGISIQEVAKQGQTRSIELPRMLAPGAVISLSHS